MADTSPTNAQGSPDPNSAEELRERLKSVFRDCFEIVSKLAEYNDALGHWLSLRENSEFITNYPQHSTLEGAFEAWRDAYNSLQTEIERVEPAILAEASALSATHEAATVIDLGVEARCWPAWVLKCAKLARPPGHGFLGIRFPPKAPHIGAYTLKDRLLNEMSEALRREKAAQQLGEQRDAGADAGGMPEESANDT